MLSKLRLFFSKPRGKITASILVIVVVALGVFLVFRYTRQAGKNGQEIPLDRGESMIQEDVSDTEMTAAGDTGQPQTISLSEGQAQPQAVESIPVTGGEPLSQEEIDAVLVRLPALPASPQEQLDFQLPEESLPPPRPGETISEPFPAASVPIGGEPSQPTVGSLEVLRYSPEGEISIAPFLSVTFNQPMVPLTTLEGLAGEQVPVQIVPALPGTWRWIGTRTLTFEYNSMEIDRLPKATNYHVTVPGGTKSMVGGVLSQAVEWTFSTPAPKVTSTYPVGEAQPRDPLFFIAFDQRIDPQAVLSTVQVSAGRETVSTMLASQEQIDANTTVKNLVKNTPEGRFLVFQAAELLPSNATISVTIGPGTPSAEGPLVTTETQGFSFQTYAPLRIDESGCSWSDSPCPPLTPFFIRFNNPLDTQAFQDGMVRIEPELPSASTNIIGNTLEITGSTQGSTTYHVWIDGRISDIFGQTLGQDANRTFRVGKAVPMLSGPGENFITLDPASTKPVFTVYTINYNELDVTIHAVQPTDWPAYQEYLRKSQMGETTPAIPGRQVMDETIPVEGANDTLAQVDIDLSPWMDGNFGHFIIIVAPPEGMFKDDEIYWRRIVAWVQITQVGMDAFADHSSLVVWTTSLKDGAPLPDVQVSAMPGERVLQTNPDGIVKFDLASQGIAYLVARQGADQALLPPSTYFWDESRWTQRPVDDELRWYVFDDRQMYRPGETVNMKGWLRRVGGKQNGDVGLVSGKLDIVYTITDPQGNEIASGRTQANALGGFDFTFDIPTNANLGYAQVYLDAEGQLAGVYDYGYYHSFQIQEFRRPEFEVIARNESPGPYFAGDSATVAVKAEYYAGGGLPNAEVNWQVSSSPSSYAPPNWPDFTFGTWTPWWWVYEPVYRGVSVEYGDTQIQTFSGVTDANGEHYLRLDFPQPAQATPSSIIAEAVVFDVNRQAWASTTTLLVHPANLYVGLRSENYFIERGKPLKVDLIVTDLDGNPVADRPIDVQAARLEWKYKDGTWQEIETDVQTCRVGSTQEPVSCVFETPEGGSYKISAVISDELGRQNRSEFTRWVSGGQQPPARKVEQETASLIPDKETYQPGDVARVLVQSPFTPAEGLLTVNRSGIVYTESFKIVDGTATLEIPIQESHIPNLNIQVDLAGNTPRLDDLGEPIQDVPPRPAFASGTLNLKIPPMQRSLSLDVKPEQAELEPGGSTTLAITVKDAAGQPIPGAEMAVVVVDEAILALSNYQMADPLAVFYTDRPFDLSSTYGRSSIILVDPLSLSQAQQAKEVEVVEEMAVESLSRDVAQGTASPAMAEMALSAPAPAADESAPTPLPIQVRSDFNPLAVFAPAVVTGAQGEARVEVKLPDNLTRYRVMVVAVSGGNQFGQAETNLVARLPLMLRPSAPRFLNMGDQFELPLVLQNQTDQPRQVDVVVQVSNLSLITDSSDLSGSAGVRVTVPARDRIEVRFPAKTSMAGTAHIQVAIVSGEFADASTLEMPVYTPATSEAFATYGVLDEGPSGYAVAQPVATPTDVFSQYGGLEITTSSTALQALTDAVIYLVSYPFECSEQIASRLLAVTALRDVLTAFEAEGLPTPEDLEKAVMRDLERLQGMQNDDGGFPYWRRGQESIPFNTIHVAHALQMAQKKGFEVPAEMWQPTLEYVRQVESHYPTWYNQNTRWTLSAYALYVRDQMGDPDPEKARRLYEEAGLENLGLDAVGWLWSVLQDTPGSEAELEEIRTYLNNRIVETANAANFTDEYDDQVYLLLSSDRRTDAILLDALITDNPESDLIVKLVNGLLAHSTQGRWGSTQENVFVLLALDHYFNTFEAQTPDFVARIWLGETYVGVHTYEGYSSERYKTTIPMAYLLDQVPGGELQDLVLGKEGPGRLYYRLGMHYAPSDLQIEPLEMGFVVQRRYEAVDQPEDVTQDENGVWHIKSGARVRVRLTMVADNRRYHVALVDPLPAGLEIVNPSLAVSQSIPQDPSSVEQRSGWWWWPWYEHQNLRDERAEAFTPLLWEGVYVYTYIARATTPGTYIVPPAKAEEMYSPEVFGRSGSDRVVVE
jgi:alpha-2-macroglobulin